MTGFKLLLVKKTAFAGRLKLVLSYVKFYANGFGYHTLSDAENRRNWRKSTPLDRGNLPKSGDDRTGTALA